MSNRKYYPGSEIRGIHQNMKLMKSLKKSNSIESIEEQNKDNSNFNDQLINPRSNETIGINAKNENDRTLTSINKGKSSTYKTKSKKSLINPLKAIFKHEKCEDSVIVKWDELRPAADDYDQINFEITDFQYPIFDITKNNDNNTENNCCVKNQNFQQIPDDFVEISKKLNYPQTTKHQRKKSVQVQNIFTDIDNNQINLKSNQLNKTVTGKFKLHESSCETKKVKNTTVKKIKFADDIENFKINKKIGAGSYLHEDTNSPFFYRNKYPTFGKFDKGQDNNKDVYVPLKYEYKKKSGDTIEENEQTKNQVLYWKNKGNLTINKPIKNQTKLNNAQAQKFQGKTPIQAAVVDKLGGKYEDQIDLIKKKRIENDEFGNKTVGMFNKEWWTLAETSPNKNKIKPFASPPNHK